MGGIARQSSAVNWNVSKRPSHRSKVTWPRTYTLQIYVRVYMCVYMCVGGLTWVCITIMTVICPCCDWRLIGTHSEFTFTNKYQNSVVLCSCSWAHLFTEKHESVWFISLLLKVWFCPVGGGGNRGEITLIWVWKEKRGKDYPDKDTVGVLIRGLMSQ